MKKSRTNRGITLIALIITIIVMIILIGVTVAIALEGEMFETAGTAALGTEKHEIYDQILGAMNLTDNGEIDADGTYDAAKGLLEAEGRVVGALGADGTFTVTGNRGTYAYKITGTKIEIIDKEATTGTLQYGKKYVGNMNYYENGEIDESVSMNFTFLEEYSKAFMMNDEDDRDGQCGDYEYNEEDKIVRMLGMPFNVSEDGKTLSFIVPGEMEFVLNATEEDTFANYNPVNTTIDVHTGWYYNYQTNKFINIIIDEQPYNRVSIWCEEDMDGSGGNQGSNTLAGIFEHYANKFGITVIDSTHIMKNGYKYTLLSRTDIEQGKFGINTELEDGVTYYDIAFDVDLSTSGYEELVATNANKVFAFETLDGTKGVIMLGAGPNLIYYTDTILDVSKYSYTYIPNSGWTYLNDMTVGNPPQVNRIKIITDVSEVENILNSVASGGQIDYEFIVMTNEEISKIVTVTQHQ